MRLKRSGFYSKLFAIILISAFSLAWPQWAGADAAFDLLGPRIQVRVKRAGETLPIARVPDLQPGDRLWIHPDLPDNQSVHYVMVVVFLRGATNPPPESWFTHAETWTKPVREEGIFVNVPQGAEEAVVLLAPDTGGAFSTLRAAVRSKPGAFVRAAQDLEQASLDRARLEAYLSAVRETSANDPDQLKARTTLLASSLNVRLEQQCFDKPTAQQVPCLTQNTDQLVLDDAHSQTMVAMLTTGAPTDLVTQLSSTPTARSGYYSPYIGAVVDVVRILSTAHTAQYQYIPALALPEKDDLNLRLNNPPSFRNPKSVLVIGLPPVRATVLPPLRVPVKEQVFCLSKPGLVLPASGAPLIFATELGHDFRLHIDSPRGALDLPATPDAGLGGFKIDNRALGASEVAGEVSGTLRGRWGFKAFDGPRFRLRSSHPGSWELAAKDRTALIVGREDVLHLSSPAAACVSEVLIEDENAKLVPVFATNPAPDELEIKVPLSGRTPGPIRLEVKEFGLAQSDRLTLAAYAEAARLDAFILHAGDAEGVLKGTRLDQVTALQLEGMRFLPEGLSRANQQDELKLRSADAVAARKLARGQALAACVELKDGRVLDLNARVEAPRPRLALFSKSVQLDPTSASATIRLGNPDELPESGRLSFFLKAQVPETFEPQEAVEIATADEAFRARLSLKDGSLTLEDAKTVFAELDPMKLLGPSAFGPLKFRPVSSDGVEGDWQPLVNLVRMPELKGIRCSPRPSAAVAAEQVSPSEAEDGTAPEKSPALAKACALTGERLFLLDAVSTNPDFSDPVLVPDGFVETALAIPATKAKVLYVKLRDDPATVDTAELPVLPAQP